MIPLRATNYKLSRSWPSYIIIHHTYCRVQGAPVEYDKQGFQTDLLQNLNYKLNKTTETGFNFIVERVRNDFQVVVSQPLNTICKYDDLDEIYWRSIHVALMGDYDRDIPMNRMYRVLAYRLLMPLMRLFLLKENDILLHSSISKDDSVTCPGEFIDMSKILVQLRSVMRRQPLARRK